MRSKTYSILYDLFVILFTSIIFLNLVNVTTLFTILLFNCSLILLFVIIKFYKNSSVLKIFDKLKILIISITTLSILKLFYFKFQTYLQIIVFSRFAYSIYVYITKIHA